MSGTPIDQWFARRGWRPLRAQREVWARMADRESGLLVTATGTGKTLAAWFGAVRAGVFADAAKELRLLWVTPLRALARDTHDALVDAAEATPGLDIAMRTGDSGRSERARQRAATAHVLVTTPESLSLMLADPEGCRRLRSVRCLVVDEWHELLASKRGVQVQLARAALRRLCPELLTWGLSATLADPAAARAALLGPGDGGAIVSTGARKAVRIETLIPDNVERFAWGGHLGLQLLPRVVREVARSASTLLFTNTRAQAESWHRALLEMRPEWSGEIALHHGSLDADTRRSVEDALAAGTLRAVVCTSSLDLGVDFPPVERVIQIGSPKGVARLLQRAGRSGHAPGGRSRATCVPTHAFELFEAAAVRRAAENHAIEARTSPQAPLDVLVQHLVTRALGSGFRADELFDEVRSTHAFATLDPDDWRWVLDFVTRGGPSLAAYPEYRRVVEGEDGIHRVPDRAIAQRHRMSIGTIVADDSVEVRFLRGGRIGTMEERFAARLRPGDRFQFAGRTLALVRLRDSIAWVRNAAPGPAVVPRWMGGRMPLSSELAAEVRRLVGEAADGADDLPELRALAPLLDLQRRWSRIPRPDELLIEYHETREGAHCFLFPFAGHLAHHGLGSLIAWRVARLVPTTVGIACNDYGLELRAPRGFDWSAFDWRTVLSDDRLVGDLEASLDAAELARRRFREIARVAGLVFQGFPSAQKTSRQLQASSGLLFDVFARHEPDNRLLAQARREALEQELDHARLAATLAALREQTLAIERPPRMTPFAFPLWLQHLQGRLSNQPLEERVARILAELERAADR